MFGCHPVRTLRVATLDRMKGYSYWFNSVLFEICESGARKEEDYRFAQKNNVSLSLQYLQGQSWTRINETIGFLIDSRSFSSFSSKFLLHSLPLHYHNSAISNVLCSSAISNFHEHLIADSELFRKFSQVIWADVIYKLLTYIISHKRYFSSVLRVHSCRSVMVFPSLTNSFPT